MSSRPLNGFAHLRVSLVIGALVLSVAACGGDAEDAAGDASPSPTTASPTAESPDGGEATAGEVEYEERELTFISFQTARTHFNLAAQAFMDEIEARTNGSVTFEVFYDGSLVGGADIKDGLTDGRADIGTMTYAYTPEEFPVTTVNEVPVWGDNIPAQSAALNQLFAENEAVGDEFADKGLKMLSFGGLSSTLFGSTETITGVEWLRGKTMRASAFMVTALDLVGANPVAMPVTEAYEAMQRGTIDAVGGFTLLTGIPLGLHEVAPEIADPQLIPSGSTQLAMSLDTYESFSPELQQLFDEVAAEYPAMLAEISLELADEMCQTLIDGGATLTIWPEEETARWFEEMGDAPFQGYIDKVEDLGVDGQAVIDQAEALYGQYAEGEFSDFPSLTADCAAQQNSN